MTCKEYHSKDVKVKVKLNCILNIYGFTYSPRSSILGQLVVIV